jgi:acetyltransferase-like isoleucine patch superfamily enzyme
MLPYIRSFEDEAHAGRMGRSDQEGVQRKTEMADYQIASIRSPRSHEKASPLDSSRTGQIPCWCVTMRTRARSIIARMLRSIVRRVRWWKAGWSHYGIVLIGKLPGHSTRRTLYRWLCGFSFPANSVLYGGAEIRNCQNLKIGDNTVIGHHAILDARRGIELGNNVNLSTGVWIWTEQHDPNDPDFAVVGGKVAIEDYAWISCRVVILPGVKIGQGCVVAAGAVVAKDAPAWSIIGGVPAAVIGQRNRNMRYQLCGYIPII